MSQGAHRTGGTSGRRTLFGVLAATTVAAFAAAVWSGGWLSRGDTGSAGGLVMEDVARDVGLEFQHGVFRWGLSADPVAMMGGGLCWLDYNADGWMDLFVVNGYSTDEWGEWQEVGGLPTSRLFFNDRGRFIDVTDATGAGLELRGQGCVAADFDGDGHTDLYVTSERFNALLVNRGDGTFDERAAEAGVEAYGWHSGAAAGDLNGDGLMDLFVSGYVDMNRPKISSSQGFPNDHEAEPDLLFVNRGVGDDGTPRFEEVSTLVGIEVAGEEYGLGAVLTDVDGDADLDLYVANDTNPNRLYLNEPAANATGFRLREVGAESAVDDDNSGMGVAVGDFDTSGSLDLFVTNLGTQSHALLASGSPGDPFRVSGESTGLAGLEGEYTGWGAILADFDLDSDLDLLVANGNVPVTYPSADRQPLQLFLNELAQGAGAVFVDGSQGVGLRSLGPLLARGAAAADYDNDGDLDVAVNTVGEDLVLLRNGVTGRNWLTVAVDATPPGTRAVVLLSDGTRLVREIRAGESYLSSSDGRLHFGLGGASSVEKLTVTFPDGSQRSWFDVAANQLFKVWG